AVVKSEVDHPADDDVLRKVFEDLKGSGVAVTEGDVRMKMAEFMAQAREEAKGKK
ncbi:ATPase inhibitor subunit zeta, partial [Phenylobacterium sp.]|uniref:ATPase inhibitor subunit zeta n=1 Tax=Phenylobacterium sp. TaxID=1871053 RepID=UPI002DF16720|nr:ATPase inhibitor subunit zeta [Phenylobacterium sp.]